MITREEVKKIKDEWGYHRPIAEWKIMGNSNTRWLYHSSKLWVKRYMKIIKLSGLKSLHNFLVLQLDSPLAIQDRPIYMQHNYHEKQREMATSGRA